LCRYEVSQPACCSRSSTIAAGVQRAGRGCDVSHDWLTGLGNRSPTRDLTDVLRLDIDRYDPLGHRLKVCSVREPVAAAHLSGLMVGFR